MGVKDGWGTELGYVSYSTDGQGVGMQFRVAGERSGKMMGLGNI